MELKWTNLISLIRNTQKDKHRHLKQVNTIFYRFLCEWIRKLSFLNFLYQVSGFVLILRFFAYFFIRFLTVLRIKNFKAEMNSPSIDGQGVHTPISVSSRTPSVQGKSLTPSSHVQSPALSSLGQNTTPSSQGRGCTPTNQSQGRTEAGCTPRVGQLSVEQRKVRDMWIDWNNNIQEWKMLNCEGLEAVTTIVHHHLTEQVNINRCFNDVKCSCSETLSTWFMMYY